MTSLDGARLSCFVRGALFDAGRVDLENGPNGEAARGDEHAFSARDDTISSGRGL
jgi:hypothetical protein